MHLKRTLSQLTKIQIGIKKVVNNKKKMEIVSIPLQKVIYGKYIMNDLILAYDNKNFNLKKIKILKKKINKLKINEIFFIKFMLFFGINEIIIKDKKGKIKNVKIILNFIIIYN